MTLTEHPRNPFFLIDESGIVYNRFGPNAGKVADDQTMAPVVAKLSGINVYGIVYSTPTYSNTINRIEARTKEEAFEIVRRRVADVVSTRVSYEYAIENAPETT